MQYVIEANPSKIKLAVMGYVISLIGRPVLLAVALNGSLSPISFNVRN